MSTRLLLTLLLIAAFTHSAFQSLLSFKFYNESTSFRRACQVFCGKAASFRLFELLLVSSCCCCFVAWLRKLSSCSCCCSAVVAAFLLVAWLRKLSCCCFCCCSCSVAQHAQHASEVLPSAALLFSQFFFPIFLQTAQLWPQLAFFYQIHSGADDSTKIRSAAMWNVTNQANCTR